MNRCFAIFFLCAGVLVAQDGGDKTSVPLKDPSRPARINAHLTVGNITVRGGDVKEVIVEAHGHGRIHRDEPPSARADGLRRLDVPGGSGVDVIEDNNVVNIRTNSMTVSGDLVVTVPRRSSLELRSMSGEINVEGVDGEIDVNTMSGKLVLKNVSGSVVAHSMNGAVLVSLDRVDPSKPMSFSTMNGDIDVTLPDSVKADLRVKVDNGEVYTDFDVKVSPQSGTWQADRDHGQNPTHHVRLDRTLRGTINGGGAELQFTSFNGQVYIRRKK